MSDFPTAMRFHPDQFIEWSAAFAEQAARRDFQSSMNPYRDGLQLGHLNVVVSEGSGTHSGGRGLHQIRRDRADFFVLNVPISARLDIVQNGLESHILPGSCTLVATSKPSRATVAGVVAGDRFRFLHVRIPSSLLRQRLFNADDLCNVAVSLTNGAGAILGNLSRTLVEECRSIGHAQGESLGRALFEVICSVMEPESAAISLQPSTHDPTPLRIYRKACSYIEANLGDAGLNVRRVAEHCGVSVRYLHLAFSQSSCQAWALIRERRLENCRNALLSPLCRNHSISQIASEWGFDDPAHFSHSYKARFGHTPSQERSGSR